MPSLPPPTASRLYRRLWEGPGRSCKPSDPPHDQAHEGSWWGLSHLIAQRRMAVDPTERHAIKSNAPKSPLDLVIDHLADSLPRDGTSKKADFTYSALEEVGVQLLKRNCTPHDPESAYAMKVALLSGALRLFDELWTQAPVQGRDALQHWLHEPSKVDWKRNSWSNPKRGVQFLTQGGQCQSLQHLRQKGLITPEDAQKHGLVFYIQHVKMIDLLASWGVDPCMQGSTELGKGKQAVQGFAYSVQSAGAQIALRKAWYQTFARHPGVVAHERVARESLGVNLLHANADLIGFDLSLCGQGGRVNGVSLAQMAADQAMSLGGARLGGLRGEARDEAVARALEGVDFTRMLPCGVSEGFYFSMAAFNEQPAWSAQQKNAFAACPEATQPLMTQVHALHLLARHWAGSSREERVFSDVFEQWWGRLFSHDRSRSLTDKLIELSAVDPGDPQGRSVLELPELEDHWKWMWNRELTEGDLARLVQDAVHPSTLLHLGLDYLADTPFPSGGGNPNRHYIPLPYSPTAPAKLLLLEAAINADIRPTYRWYQSRDEEWEDRLKKNAPTFYQRTFQPWALDVATPESPSKNRARRL